MPAFKPHPVLWRIFESVTGRRYLKSHSVQTGNKQFVEWIKAASRLDGAGWNQRFRHGGSNCIARAHEASPYPLALSPDRSGCAVHWPGNGRITPDPSDYRLVRLCGRVGLSPALIPLLQALACRCRKTVRERVPALSKRSPGYNERLRRGSFFDRQPTSCRGPSCQ